ncbi:MAG: zinc dependent phospholipase C family protein [Deltaproteobacteria bacterium]|nr:zinc dependent phospholipase C family protein [Deltaproteobacteria bacterium]
MHTHITRTAFEHLPEHIQEVFEPYLDSILWESMSPDLFLRDWPNHEWNIHRAPGDNTAAPVRIQSLAQEILDALRQLPPDISEAADKLGLLSHYLADISQPLHTDEYAEEESWIHIPYEKDVYVHQAELTFDDRGTRFRPDIYNTVIDSARQANMYYQAIIDAYAMGDGYAGVRQISQLNYERAVHDIADVWTTLWLLATSDAPSLALQVNQGCFRPGDMIQLKLTALPGSNQPQEADLYVAVTDASGTLWFMTPGPEFSRDLSPLHTSLSLPQSEEQILFAAPVESCDADADFTVYALLAATGSDLSKLESWLSNLASVNFRVEPLPDDLLADLRDESYLFPAGFKGSHNVVGLPLQRWDFIFLGEKTDDPATPEDETLLNRLIPGNFRHAVIYLGRDSLGRPSALEFAASEPHLRVTRLPEFESVYPSGTSLVVPVSIKNIQAYQNRWAKRLQEQELQKLRAAEGHIFDQVRRDFQMDIPYQMEYNWSGDFADREIYLVDDGLENGAGCTDYLLFLLEESAGVCIHGSRMTAAEVEEYFRFDPVGSTVAIPDEWNPFPFPVKVIDVLNMGYYLKDPPPHIFPCDNSEETGVPIPANLINSPQFSDITPVPVPAVYDSWAPEQMEDEAKGE